MKVKEVIEKLKGFDQDLEVVVWTKSDFWCDTLEVTLESGKALGDGVYDPYKIEGATNVVLIG